MVVRALLYGAVCGEGGGWGEDVKQTEEDPEHQLTPTSVTDLTDLTAEGTINQNTVLYSLYIYVVYIIYLVTVFILCPYISVFPIKDLNSH